MDTELKLVKNITHKYKTLSQSYSTIIACCSAGSDSIALVALLLKLANKYQSLVIEIAHVNFHLRGTESNEDEFFVRQFAQNYNLNCHILDASLPCFSKHRGEGTQEWARRIRYEWFAQLSHERCALIALAHHEDDVAENALLRMARGCGPGQLAGMSLFSKPYWRPLLDVSKDELNHFLSGQSLPHRFDSSNGTLNYSRNRVRLLVMKELEALYPGCSSRIARMAFEAADLASFARQHILIHYRLNESNKLIPFLSCKELVNMPVGVALEAFGQLVRMSRTQLTQLSRSQLYEVLDRLISNKNDEHHHYSVEIYPGGYLTINGDAVFVSTTQKSSLMGRQRRTNKLISKGDQVIALAPQDAVQIKRGGSMLLWRNQFHSKMTTYKLSPPLRDDLLTGENTEQPVSVKKILKKRNEKRSRFSLLSIDGKNTALLDSQKGTISSHNGNKDFFFH